MLWVTILIQWIHVIGGGIWLGSNVFAFVVIAPTIAALPLEQQRKFYKLYEQNAGLLLPITSFTVVIAGVLRGTVFGPVRSLDYLMTTPYGITFLVSFILGVGLILWAVFVMIPHTQKLQVMSLSDDVPAPELQTQMKKVKLVTMIDLAGFCAILLCMVLMRFGY